ncbi:RNA polymerase sigma factor [soil metagenome]
MINETSFIKKLRAGDHAAFNELVEIYRGKVINTCYRFLADQEDAEDVSQDIFIEIYQSLRTFKGDAKLSTWIYRITVYKCLDAIKKRKRKKRLSSIGQLLHLDEIAQWLSGGSRPDITLEVKEQYRYVYEALNALPENQRVAFTLSKMEGYSNQEIAEIMDTSVMAVESMIYRAKKRVHEELLVILKKK